MAVIRFIETEGLVGSIEVTDAMLEAADVELVGTDTIGADLVTVVVTGEVGAMKTATKAGAEATSKVGELLAVHVTPRLHTDIAKVLPKLGPAAE